RRLEPTGAQLALGEVAGAGGALLLLVRQRGARVSYARLLAVLVEAVESFLEAENVVVARTPRHVAEAVQAADVRGGGCDDEAPVEGWGIVAGPERAVVELVDVTAQVDQLGLRRHGEMGSREDSTEPEAPLAA